MVDTLATFQASMAAAAVGVSFHTLKLAEERAPIALRAARTTVAKDTEKTMGTIKTKAYRRQDEVYLEIRARGAALFLEFGTVNMAPQPFMFKALKQSEDPMVEAMADLGERLLSG